MALTDTHWNMTPNKKLAKHLALRDMPVLVYEAVNLEGIAMTLPEVQTILDGVTVGGHKISDQQIVINQARTWVHLFQLIDEKRFEFSIPIALELHAIAAKEEAFEWGVFRTGNVTIGGTEYEPPDPETLDEVWLKIELEVAQIQDIYDRAAAAFLRMARSQFFWDVNKRMGRFMMNGILLDAGYPVINVPVKKQLEFNQLMLEYYASNEMDKMNIFLRDCLNERLIDNFKQH